MIRFHFEKSIWYTFHVCSLRPLIKLFHDCSKYRKYFPHKNKSKSVKYTLAEEKQAIGCSEIMSTRTRNKAKFCLWLILLFPIFLSVRCKCVLIIDSFCTSRSYCESRHMIITPIRPAESWDCQFWISNVCEFRFHVAQLASL